MNFEDKLSKIEEISVHILIKADKINKKIKFLEESLKCIPLDFSTEISPGVLLSWKPSTKRICIEYTNIDELTKPLIEHQIGVRLEADRYIDELLDKIIKHFANDII